MTKRITDGSRVIDKKMSGLKVSLGEPRTETLSSMVTCEEYEIVDEFVRFHGMSKSNYIRDLILNDLLDKRLLGNKDGEVMQ